MKKSWYADGLRFSCTQCGDCCTGEPGYVWLTRAEIRRLARFLEVTVNDFGERYLRQVGRRYSLIERPNGDCAFYDKGCSVYPVRPLQCRSYPFWHENLESSEAWLEVADECPGVNQGRLYAVEEISIVRKGKSDASAS